MIDLISSVRIYFDTFNYKKKKKL